MRKPTEAEILQASAIVVASPRYMGAFAAAIGLDVLAYWPWFATIEIASGAAMAILEGWAVAFMFRKWRGMPPLSTHWCVLLLLQFLLMLALPATATPYLVSSQLKEPVSAILSWPLLWLWSFTVAAIAPLVLAAVGYADVERVVTVSEAVIISQEGSEPVLYGGLRVATSEAGPPVACPDCGREFPSRNAVNAHRRFCTARIVLNGKGE